ncbi:MAG: undecaprenyl-diphosphate phosphatase [Burkholderiales bacterium]|nr:undecaprenyl-diphosphate phosphatase [Burkholderiales bacterium]
MDFMLLFKALVLGIVEGLTEFLPISSTGHLIVVSDLIGFNGETSVAFVITIQLGAIFAVCWEYRGKLLNVVSGLHADPAARRFAGNLLVAFTPAAVVGAVFHASITQVLFHPLPVAVALIAGGVLILWVERRPRAITIREVDDLRWQDALKIGCAQSLALIPGVSRSGATIIGALYFGMSRRAATEFSFFLAVPTMFAAVAYQLYTQRDILRADDIGMFATGFVASFIAAFLTVRGLLHYVSRHDFSVFAYYRIAFGMLILATAYTGVVNWS